MKEADDEIRSRYEFDQGHVQDEDDKSLFLLPVEVRIKRHNIYQKRRWVESVDLAYNAWHRTKVAGNNDEGRHPRVRKKPT